MESGGGEREIKRGRFEIFRNRERRVRGGTDEREVARVRKEQRGLPHTPPPTTTKKTERKRVQACSKFFCLTCSAFFVSCLFLFLFFFDRVFFHRRWRWWSARENEKNIFTCFPPSHQIPPFLPNFSRNSQKREIKQLRLRESVIFCFCLRCFLLFFLGGKTLREKK